MAAMETIVIPIGDGRLVELEEGALRVPPPVPEEPKVKRTINRVVKKKVVRSKNYYVTRNGKKYLRKQPPPDKRVYTDEEKAEAAARMMESHQKHLAIPGYIQWRNLRGEEIRNASGKKQGRKLGQADGLTPAQTDRLWAEARRKARSDMENIKKVVPDLGAAAQEALYETLTVMRSPMSQQVKLAAAKQVLEYTMAKPVAKSEVTVNAAEKWLAELANDET